MPPDDERGERARQAPTPTAAARPSAVRVGAGAPPDPAKRDERDDDAERDERAHAA